MKKELDLTKHYTGTCQACFRAQSCVARAGAGHLGLVHHGYERPGHGYISGDCAGVDHVPYELSCDLSKTFLVAVKGSLARLTAEHVDLVADVVDSISTITKITLRYGQKVPEGEEGWLPTYKRGWGAPIGYHKSFYFDVKRDHVPSKARGEREPQKHWDGRVDAGHDFEHYRQARIRELSGFMKQAQDSIAFLEKCIRDWVFAPEKLQDYGITKSKTILHWLNPRMRRAVCQGPMSHNTNVAYAKVEGEVTCKRCLKWLQAP